MQSNQRVGEGLLSPHHLLAQRLVLAMMRSASTDKISPKQWWERARSALETAAVAAESWPHLISEMARKLQIETLSAPSANEVCSMVSEATPFEEFRSVCERDALYVVALAQAQRAQEREQHRPKEINTETGEEIV